MISEELFTMSVKVGLVLGGGGARGIAHIAYLNALDELDIKPDIIAGTGVGALAGALYASGISPDEMVGILEELDFRRSMKILNNYSFKDGKFGVLDAIGLEEYLELVMPVKIFDRLYVPLKIVAADYETRKQHVFEHGKVVPAVRASLSVPGVFSPIEVDEAIYIDGGCINPVPTDVIRDECDVVIAVDITGKGASESEISVASTANDLSQCYQIMTKALIEEKNKNVKVDVMASPALVGVEMLDFFNYENILEAVEDDIEDFKVAVCKLLKPELLNKSGKPPRPKKRSSDKAVKPKEEELEEEYYEEQRPRKSAKKAAAPVVPIMSKGKEKRLAKKAAKQAEIEAYLAQIKAEAEAELKAYSTEDEEYDDE